jgi:hypothetical protein
MIRGELNVQRVWLSVGEDGPGVWVHTLRINGRPQLLENLT